MPVMLPPRKDRPNGPGYSYLYTPCSSTALKNANTLSHGTSSCRRCDGPSKRPPPLPTVSILAITSLSTSSVVPKGNGSLRSYCPPKCEPVPIKPLDFGGIHAFGLNGIEYIDADLDEFGDDSRQSPSL